MNNQVEKDLGPTQFFPCSCTSKQTNCQCACSVTLISTPQKKPLCCCRACWLFDPQLTKHVLSAVNLSSCSLWNCTCKQKEAQDHRHETPETPANHQPTVQMELVNQQRRNMHICVMTWENPSDVTEDEFWQTAKNKIQLGFEQKCCLFIFNI